MLNTIVFINALSAGNDGDSTRQDIHGREAGKGFPLEIKHEEAQDGVWIRYFYHGGKLTRDGRLIRLMLNSDDAEHGNVKATQVIDLLQQENIDLRRFCPHAYDRDLEAWAPLSGETTFSIAEEGPQRIDVQLFTSAAIPGSNSSERNLDESDFCSIGVFGAKSEKNLGTLWRSGYQLGAAEVFVIGERFRTESKKRQKDKLLRVKQNLGRSRMLRSDDSIPLHEFQGPAQMVLFFLLFLPHSALALCVCVSSALKVTRLICHPPHVWMRASLGALTTAGLRGEQTGTRSLRRCPLTPASLLSRWEGRPSTPSSTQNAPSTSWGPRTRAYLRQ